MKTFNDFLNEDVDSRAYNYVCDFLYDILNKRITWNKEPYMDWKHMMIEEQKIGKYIFTVDGKKFEISIKQK